MENSLAQDYVTEKVYDALAAGCLPIYYGAPNIGTAPADRASAAKWSFSSPSQRSADTVTIFAVCSMLYMSQIVQKMSQDSQLQMGHTSALGQQVASRLM